MIVKAFKDRVQKAEDKIKAVEALKQLKAELDKLGPVPFNVANKEVYNPYSGQKDKLPIPQNHAVYDYAVKYFNIIAQFQDKDLMRAELFADNESAKELSAHISNSGRGAWVRAAKGEQVTDDNVYLGNIFGIWTFNIRKFKELSRNTADNTRDWTEWAIQIYQLKSFLDSHIEPMKQLIASILVTEQRAQPSLADRMFTKIATRSK